MSEFKEVPMSNLLSVRRSSLGVATASVALAFGSMAPAQAFIVPSGPNPTPTSTSIYSQYQNPIYTQSNPWISIDRVTYGTGTGANNGGVESSFVDYIGEYNPTETGLFGLWQVGNPNFTVTGGVLDFWSNTGNNPTLSLSFGLGDNMRSYLGVVSRRVTDGSKVEAFMWTRIDEDAYWNNYNSTTRKSSVITPDPANEQYLLWITNSPKSTFFPRAQVNSAPIVDDLSDELKLQIADGTGGTAPSADGGSSTSGGSYTGGGVENVPGPLPLLGLVAAFGWARRLRRVVRAARE